MEVLYAQGLTPSQIRDTIVYFRGQYMVYVAKFAYTCAVEGVTLETIINRFMMDA